MQIVHADYIYPAYSVETLEQMLLGRDCNVLYDETTRAFSSEAKVPERHVLAVGQLKRCIIVVRRDADLCQEIYKHYAMIRDGLIDLTADDGYWYPFANRLISMLQERVKAYDEYFRGRTLIIVTAAIIYGTRVESQLP